MSKEDCQEGNWHSQGRKDALRGFGSNQIGLHKKFCSDLNIKPDEQAYSKGYKEGLQLFCTYKSGYNFGLNGGIYHDSCPAELEKDFYQGYVTGKNRKEDVDRRSSWEAQERQHQDEMRKALINQK